MTFVQSDFFLHLTAPLSGWPGRGEGSCAPEFSRRAGAQTSVLKVPGHKHVIHWFARQALTRYGDPLKHTCGVGASGLCNREDAQTFIQSDAAALCSLLRGIGMTPPAPPLQTVFPPGACCAVYNPGNVHHQLGPNTQSWFGAGQMQACVHEPFYPPPPFCISYALVQATVGVGTVLI